jgi:hypothetical protein
MCGTKIIAILATIVAVAMAVVVTIWHDTAITQIMYISRFIDVMLPVLAVGALFKYLFHCCSGSKKE